MNCILTFETPKEKKARTKKKGTLLEIELKETFTIKLDQGRSKRNFSQAQIVCYRVKQDCFGSL